MQGANNLSNARHLTYLDFELQIGLGSGREYPVTVVRSPAGEARETLRFPFDELALESRLDKLQIALLRSGGQRRRALLPEEQAVQEFGRALFDSLVVGEVRSRYDVSQRDAARQGKGLRLKLRIQPPELAALPWEYLYDSRQAEYVCLSRNTPVVRYLELPQPILPLTVTPPLRILGMVASPNDLPLLDVAREKQRVENAIQALRANGLVELTWLEGQTWRDLQRAMRGGPWHVFHFIGHGGYDRQTEEGCIALADEEGQASRLSATQLGRLLADHRSLRMVLLNACEGARGSERDIFSGAAAILVRRGIPAVLAMQYEITDRAAIEFARTFYEALTDEMPVDEAVTEARKAISMMVANTFEWGTPVLYMRSPEGMLFNLEVVRQARRTAVRLEREHAEREAQEKAAQEEATHRAKEAKRLEQERRAREEAAKREAERQAQLAAENAEAIRKAKEPKSETTTADESSESPRSRPQHIERDKIEENLVASSGSPQTLQSKLVSTISLETLGGISTPLLRKGIGLPSKMSQTFSTASDKQSLVEVHLVYGNNKMAADNTSLGRFILDGIPPAPKGVPQIDVQIQVDANQILSIVATDRATNRSKKLGSIDLSKIEPPSIIDPLPDEQKSSEPPNTGGDPGGFDWSQWMAGGQPGGTRAEYSGNLDDLFGSGGFSDFFGSIFGGTGAGTRRSPSAQGVRGRDYEQEIEITLEEAFAGTSRVLSKDGQRIEVKIPAGVDNGTRIRLAGMGEHGQGKDSDGDLYVVIRVAQHPVFTRIENDISISIPITSSFATSGGQIRVPGLEVGKFSLLKLPPNTPDGRKFRLKGQGVKSLKSEEKGDLIVTVQVFHSRNISADIQKRIQLVKHRLKGLDIQVG